jgi:hypothetical protein
MVKMRMSAVVAAFVVGVLGEAAASVVQLAPVCEQLGIDGGVPFSNSADSIAELFNASVLTADIRPARISSWWTLYDGTNVLSGLQVHYVDGSNITKESKVFGTTTGTPVG